MTMSPGYAPYSRTPATCMRHNEATRSALLVHRVNLPRIVIITISLEMSITLDLIILKIPVQNLSYCHKLDITSGEKYILSTSPTQYVFVME